jgi:hypothetical protein
VTGAMGILVPMPRDRENGNPLAVKVVAGALGAAAGFAGPDAAVAGAGLAPVIEDVFGQIWSRLSAKRAERVAETLLGAAEELSGDTAEQLRRFAAAAASDETYQELLARTLTVAQDTAMRDKRRALSRALANALGDVGTKVDNEIAFVRMLADLDPVHIRVLKIMSRRPKHLDRVALQMNATDDPKAARQWYEWSITHEDPGLEESVWGALQVLEQHGLIWDRGEQLVPAPHGMQHEYEISPYGDYLISRLAEPD